MLYTTADEQRCVRTCNLVLSVVTLASNVFRFAGSDTLVSHLLHESVCFTPSLCSFSFAGRVDGSCSSILRGCRRNCAAATAPS
ncbi:hypothetical protein BC629DRAFT_1510270 [Irpex lacteus]|nr:hypothetical protein BC629DRAFT_1510270 [Irpex lacteus]